MNETVCVCVYVCVCVCVCASVLERVCTQDEKQKQHRHRAYPCRRRPRASDALTKRIRKISNDEGTVEKEEPII